MARSIQNRDGNVTAYYAAIEREIDRTDGPGAGKLELLLIHSITSCWRGDARRAFAHRHGIKVIGKAWPDYTITIKLIHDADDELVSALDELLGLEAVLTEKGPRLFKFHFEKVSPDLPSIADTIVRTAVKAFYKRHNLP